MSGMLGISVKDGWAGSAAAWLLGNCLASSSCRRWCTACRRYCWMRAGGTRRGVPVWIASCRIMRFPSRSSTFLVMRAAETCSAKLRYCAGKQARLATTRRANQEAALELGVSLREACGLSGQLSSHEHTLRQQHHITA